MTSGADHLYYFVLERRLTLHLRADRAASQPPNDAGTTPQPRRSI